MKQKIILLCVLILGIISFIILKPNPKVIKNNDGNENNNNLISVLVDGVEQSAFPSKGSAEYQSTSCTNGETAVWDEANWKLSIQDISASTRCVVSFVTGGHNVYVTVSGGTVDNAPKNVPHNGNVTFNVASSNNNYVFSSVKCSGANSYTWANNILSVNGVTADAHCEVVFSRPTYTVYFNVVGGYTADNYLTVVRGGGNSTTFGAVPGYLTGGSRITCDPGITGKISGTRIVLSNVLSSGDCQITCARDTSSYLPGGATYNPGDEVSYANLAWLVVKSDEDTVTLILKSNATYTGTSSSNTTGTGIFGSGVTFTSSSARSYLQDIWLQQDAQKYLRTAIDSEGLAYQEDANGYIRLPYMREVSRKIPNASKTSFWTMDNDGENHVYYGQPDGYGSEGLSSTDNKYYYEFYTLAENKSVEYNSVGSYNNSCNVSGNYYNGIMGAGNTSNYNSSSYCTSTSNLLKQNPVGGYHNLTCTVTLNPFSGANAYTAGAYSNGYKKWVKNAGTETKSSTATLLQTLNYNNRTTGNSGMTTGVQAVSPNESKARTNDTAPVSSSQNIQNGKLKTAQQSTCTTNEYLSDWCIYQAAGYAYKNGTSVNIWPYTDGKYYLHTYYFNWGADACVNSNTNYCQRVNNVLKNKDWYYCDATKGATYAANTYFTSGCCGDFKAFAASGRTSYTHNYNSTSVTGVGGSTLGSCTKRTKSSAETLAVNTDCTYDAVKQYTRYTLQPYNSADIGYRPVIVVYKAN